MKLTPEELPQNGFVLLDHLDHKDLVPFIQTYIKKKTNVVFSYYFFNIIFVVIMAIIYVMGVRNHDFKWGHGITHLSYSLAISILLVPIHEYIHVLAYRSQGAKHTSYDVNLKKFYFMALADKFVANKKAFYVVALAPFLSISIGALILMPFVSIEWALTISGVLIAHTSMCAGDFGMMSYFEYHNALQVVTFDDVPNGISYFWGRTKS